MVCCDGNGFCNNGFIPIGNVVRHGDKDLVYEDVSKSDDCKKETLLRKIKSVCYQLSLLEGKECFIMNLSYKKKSIIKRFVALIMAVCCMFSMFPAVAGAADDTESDTTKKEYRYIWLVSQPGFGIRITSPAAGKKEATVKFQNMSPDHAWVDTFLYTDKDTGEEYYVVKPVESSKGQIPDNSDNKGSENCYGNYQSGVGFLRLYCEFYNRVMPDSTVPAWKGATFTYQDQETKPFDKNQITNDTEKSSYWAGNQSGGSSFYIGYGEDAWEAFVKKSSYRKDGSPTESSLGEYPPSPYSIRYVQSFNDSTGTYYDAQVRIPKRWVDVFVNDKVNGGYMDNEPYRRANWANITMFQFMSDNKLPPPDQKHEEDPEMGTVIFDWNMPGSNAEVSYRKESGTKVSPPTNIQPSNVGNVSYVFEGWYDAPTGGNKIGDTVEVPDNKYVVYYAHWRVETVDPPIPEVGEGDMYVVYFDYNLPGTGVTTAYSTAGRFEWTAKVDGETKTFYVQLQFQFPDDPHRDGYTFKGWSTTYNGAVINPEAYQPKKGSKNTLYAIWVPDDCKITWNANGGTGGGSSNQQYDEKLDLTKAPTPTRTGYDFEGWYADQNCSSPVSADTIVKGNVTYYAKWVPQKVHVNYYDTREGTGLVGTQTYDYDEVLHLMSEMQDTTGQFFGGWTKTPGSKVQVSDDLKLADPEITLQKDGYWTLDLYAIWNEQHTSYTATVKWNDLQDNDGCRPKSVTIGLVSSVTNQLVRQQTLTYDGKDEQSFTFTELPITTANASTDKITYKLVFLGYNDAESIYRSIDDTAATSGTIEGSTASRYDDAVSTKYTYAINNYVALYTSYIKLDHSLITTGDDVKFSVQWDDDSNNDGVRPRAVTLNLYANGQRVKDLLGHNSGTGVVSANPAVCTVSDDGNVWTYTWRNYQKYLNGKAITYTTTVTNDDQATKYNENNYTTKYLNSANDPTGDENGAIISRDVELMDKTVSVYWDDESNRDNTRPESVDVKLTAYEWNAKTYRWETVDVGTATINGGKDLDLWTYTFNDVKKHNGGKEIIYKAEITSDLNAHITEGANGYAWTASELDIKVSHNRNTKSVPVTVEWADTQNNDNIRPSTVILQLYADGKKIEGAAYQHILSGDKTADTWNYTFENLPVYRDGEEGKEILYTASVEEAVKDSIYGTYISMANGQEEEVVRYTASYMDANGNTTANLADSAKAYVKLTHSTDQGTVYLYASWHDDQNRDGKRPSSIQVDLYKQVDGVKTFVKTYTVTAGNDNSWTYKITNLPLSEGGKPITYLADVSDDFRNNLKDTYGYTVSMEGSNVHLYYTPSVGYVTGHINWLDNDNNDNIRPAKVVGELYANGKATGQTLEFNVDNDWTQTWQDVASYYNNKGATGTPVVYTIKVTTPDGYEVTYTPESTTTIDPHDIQIDLSHGAQTKGITAKVYWDDDNNSNGKRPNSIEVQLYADGEKVVGKTATLTADNADAENSNIWAANFAGLDEYKDGKLIDYTIKLNDNTGKTYSAMTAGMHLYLSYKSAKADMSVSFRFDDNNNADGVRPEALYLVLTADGVPVDGADYKHTVYFDVDGVKWSFPQLPVYSTDGNKIKYNATVSLDSEFGATDYQIVTSKDIELSETNVQTNQIVVTLKKAAATGTETGHVYWFDANNQRGNRPNDLTIDVRSDAQKGVVGTYKLDSVTGKVTDASGAEVGTVEVSEWGSDGSSCWTYTISGLKQNSIYDGVANEIFYYASARTTGIAAWYNKVDGEDNGLDINLTHKNYSDDVGEAQQDFTINLSWMDNNNAWNYRPNTNGVDVKLLANGVEYKTIHLTQTNAVKDNTNSWTYSFTGLPTYLNGHAVVWTAEIADVNKYTSNTSNHRDYCTITMTQSVGFNFTLNWNDSDNDDAVRPSAATVDVYGDGTKVGSVTLTGTGNTWTGSIKDLPVWRTTGTTIPVNYSFRWSDDTAAAMLDEGYQAAATKNGSSVESDTWYYLSTTEWGKSDGGLNDLTGQYAWETTITRNKETKTVYAEIMWNDDANRDGKRPESVKVQLYANGKAVGEPKTLTGGSTDSTWNTNWEKQDVYDNGKPIEYTVKLVDVPNGYDATTDASGLNITLTHDPATTSVTGKVIWDDKSEAHYQYDSQYGDLVKSWYQIERTDVYMQLLVNGQPYGEPVKIPGLGYEQEDGSLATYASYTWNDVFVHENEGETNVYTISVFSDPLTALLNDGYTQTYDFSKQNEPSTTISHTYYDVRGTVYYLYNTSDEFKLANVPVTAYLYDESTKTYTAVGSTTTDANGTYELKNLPQGLLTVRATYQYGDYTYAGSVGVNLNLCDQNNADIIVNRDSTADSDLYRYTASGKAFYQTDKTNAATKTPVPEGSVVLLYKVVDGQESAQYVGMTTTKADGSYSFEKLSDGTYMVNVVFNYDGSTYTYDNTDAKTDKLNFVVSGADVKWKDIVKQVNKHVSPVDPTDPVVPTPDPEPKPEPCVVDGNVYYSDNGVHTTDPVEGVDVYIYGADGNTLVGNTTTDADGHWTIDGLTAGSYIGVFSHSANASRVLHFTISDSDFEKGTYTAAAQYFDRVSGLNTSTIRGVVLDENGKQTSALVEIINPDGDIVDVAYTDKNGAYNFTVASGITYQVKITTVNKQTQYLTAGDPDDNYTTLTNYTISGNYSIGGTAQEGATVALYKQSGDNFNLLTATLTDSKGDYAIKVTEAGNYRIAMYRNGEIYATHNTSVGYQEYEPQVSEVNGKYTISGSEPGGFDSGILYNTTTKVVKVAANVEGGSQYAISGLDAGTYRLELTKGDTKTTYYIDAPDNAVKVTYNVTVSGNVVDNSGNPMLGAVVTLLNSKDQQVGEQTVITNGKFSYANIPADNYKIKIEYPVSGTQLLDKTTQDTDSYGKSYPSGITPGDVWSWNLNAQTVSGKVTDQDGKPVSNATVVLKLNSDPDKAYGVQTDKDGNWTMGVMDGEYTASANFEFDGSHIYPATASVPVKVAGADVTGVDFIINRFTVSGSVVREGDNTPIEGADVTVTLKDGTPYYEGKTGPDGTFTVPSFPDDFHVVVKDNGQSAEADYTVSSDMPLTLKLKTPITITGIVYDTDGSVVADGIVHYTGAKSGKVYTDNKGKYKIVLNADLLGEYSLYATAAGKQSDTVTVNVKGDTTQDLTLKSSGSEIPSGDRTASGVVTDNEGNRLANAVVTIKYGNDKTKTLETSTNDHGEFRFDDLPDGTYYLTAVVESPNGYSYETNGETTIHLDGEDKTDIVLAVTLSYEVKVVVVDTNNNPIDDATVSYTGASDGSKKTNADGEATLQIAGGKYDFTASIGNRTSDTKTVTIDKATTVKLIVELTGIKNEPPVSEAHSNAINGYVYTPDGAPVEGATAKLLKYNLETEEWDVIKTTTSNADGYYEFTELDDGRYRVETNYELTTTVSTTVGTYEINGHAKDEGGNPYVGATVNLYDNEHQLIATVKTDETGYYEFTNLKAGEYEVEVIPAEDASKVTTVKTTVEPSNAVIAGTVTDINGNPVEGATVTVSGPGGEWNMTTKADGKYSFEVPDGGDYTVKITYPAHYDVATDGSYKNDPDNLIKPDLVSDNITISGHVHDTDDNAIEGANVILKDAAGNELQRTTTNTDGYYEFPNLKPGKYIVTVEVGDDHRDYNVDTSNSGSTNPDKPNPDPKPDTDKVQVNGIVVTDHKRPLAGSVITIRNMDSGKTFTITADADGKFDTGKMDKGRYEIVAAYTHKHGTNESDPLNITASQDDAVLVITLKYVDDVNGDGKDETIYAGDDDKFDTSDDWYPADIDKDGKDETIYAGDDGKPGTKDDHYDYDVDHDGKDETVWVGEDRIPGTDDDYYLSDPDKDGVDDKIYAGEDGVPGTKDDWYGKDIDGDGKDEIIHVGEDTKPGTPDDWYDKDVDNDGEDEKVWVGEDGIPGTRDDWYEKDTDGDGKPEKHPIGVIEINFNANGGSVNGSSVYTAEKSKISNLPTATRSGYTFNGWFTEATGGTQISMADITDMPITTTVYAHWSKVDSGTSGGGAGGGGSAGGGGAVAPAPNGDYIIAIDTAEGATILPNGDVSVKKGDDLNVSIKLDEKYIVKDVLVDGKSVGAVTEYSFKKVDANHTLKVITQLKTMLTDKHIAYVGGYPDGSVKPGASITRAEVAMIFYRLLNDDARTAYTTSIHNFSDVAANAWYAKAVATLANAGIITGDPQGTFRPNDTITRAEFAAIAARFDTSTDDAKGFYTDLDGHWAAELIGRASGRGWVTGYSDGTFRPNQAITRAESMTLINRVLGRDKLTSESLLDSMKKWPDNAISAWYYLAVQEATNGHDSKDVDGNEVWTELVETVLPQ